MTMITERNQFEIMEDGCESDESMYACVDPYITEKVNIYWIKNIRQVTVRSAHVESLFMIGTPPEMCFSPSFYFMFCASISAVFMQIP